MRARRIIFSAGLNPEDVLYLTTVLESVWKEVEGVNRLNGLDRAAAREGLALTILHFAARSGHLSTEEFCDEVKSAFLESTHLSLSARGSDSDQLRSSGASG
jgi:hypothetical protein